jgi:hypothetical protein
MPDVALACLEWLDLGLRGLQIDAEVGLDGRQAS